MIRRTPWLTILAVIGFALPVSAYLWFIQHYGVNVIWRDQWSDVNLIALSHSGKLSLAALWAPHNENRLLFPNLIMLGIAFGTHLNLFVEMYLSAVLLVGAIALLIITHRRRSPSTPWLLYCPVAIVLLSFVQFEDTLSGFQICWYLVMAALALSLYLLDRETLTWTAVVAAVAVGVVGSYSAFLGLLIWPVGLILLLYRKRPRAFLFTWVSAAVVTAALFFYNLNVEAYGNSTGSTRASIEHPVVAIKFFFLALGDVIGSRLPVPNPVGGPYASRSVNVAILLLGLVIFVLAVWALIRHGLRRDETSPRPIGIALIVFGLLFAASTAFERAYSIGVWYVGTSRYTTFDLLVLIGTYLTLIDGGFSWTRYRAGRMAGAGLIVVLCLQFALGLSSGIVGGQQTHRTGLETEAVILDIKHEPDSVVERIYFGPNVSFVRRMAVIAEMYRLSFLDSRASSDLPQP